MHSPPPQRHGLSFRRLALLFAALLSCTTIRTPVSTIQPEVALHGGRADPQVELWVESNRTLTAAEAEQFRGEARAALEKATEGRSQPEGDELVVIRAQGVTRTKDHKNDQTAATTGLIVGAVVIVAAVVVAVIVGASSHSSGGSHAANAPAVPAPHGSAPSIARAGGAVPAPRVVGAAPAPRVPAAYPLPHVPAPRPRLSPTPAPRAGPAVPFPSGPAWPAPHGPHGPAVDVEVGLWWAFPIYEPEPVPMYAYDLAPAPPPPPPGADDGGPAPEYDWYADEPSAGMPPAIPPDAGQITLPPPDQLPVEERGFFAGDRLVLEAVVLDRTTGEALRVKRISRKVDPRNAAGVKEAVDALLSAEGWEPPAAY
jgi:hypothetical protein